MHERDINIILIIIVAVLTVGHIEWVHLYISQSEELERLQGIENERDILSTSLEQADETIYKLCQEKDELKARLEVKHENEKELLKYDYVGEITITAYCCEKYPHICGGGNTASGTPPIPYLTCSVGDLERLPFGTVLYIEGVGIRVVQDTGAFDGTKLDVAVKTHEEAIKWKTGKHKVWIIGEKK